MPEGTPLTLFSANWTQYKPDTLPENATCEVSILDKNFSSLNTPAFLNDPSWSLIKTYNGGSLNVSEPIRYRVYFKPQTTIDSVVLDSLIFDDITLLYYGSPRFLSWSPIQ